MMNNTFFMALLSILMSVVAQFVLKAGMSSESVRQVLGQPITVQTVVTVGLNGLVVLGFALYGLGAVVWLGVLSTWDVSKAYPLVGLGFMLSLLVGFITGEDVTILRGAGVALIALGVWLVVQS
jgi:drug/metabolite transporter (DMT)-like permease